MIYELQYSSLLDSYDYHYHGKWCLLEFKTQVWCLKFYPLSPRVTPGNRVSLPPADVAIDVPRLMWS